MWAPPGHAGSGAREQERVPSTAAARARRPRRRALAGASHDVEGGTLPWRLGPREGPMTTRAAVTPALLEEYCARFRNWGRLGPDDEIGTLNFITPDVITRAARLVRQGKVISCALNFDTSGPQTGAFGRVNPIHSMVATGTDHATGRQTLAGFEKLPYGWGFADDQVTMFLPVGTQWGGLGPLFLTAPWLYEKRIAGLATDTWGAEVRPNELPGSFQPLHLVMVVNMGLLVGEIFDLEALGDDCAKDGVHEFMFVAPPLPITRAVGSPINPQAIK